MTSSESLYPEDWLRIAEKDLVRVERQLRNQDYDDAGFHLQQALEKFLKAFLLAHGWQLERTHRLPVLLNYALAFDASLEPYRDVCITVTSFYLTER